jgi:hypothetical protein
MTQETMEVKVAKLETKVDIVLKEIAEVKATLKDIRDAYIKRDEFEEFKAEFNRKQAKGTLLTAITTFVVTALISYVINDFLNN